MLTLAALIACLMQDADNPAYKSWSKMKPGTKLTVRTESESGAAKSEAHSTYELVSVDEKSVTLTVTGHVVANNQKIETPERKETVHAKVKPEAVDPKAKVEEGDEEVEILGRKMKCHWVKKTTDRGFTKSWTSDEVPGSLVKVESEQGGVKTRKWVTELQAK